MKYSVKTFRDAGLEARWTRTRNGAPIIAARKLGDTYYVVCADMWKAMQTEGVFPAFDRYTVLGKYFSIAA